MMSLFGKPIWNYIDPNNALDSRDRHWKNLYSRNLISPPNFFGEHGHIEDSLIVVDRVCSVDSTVKHSSYQQKLQVREGAVVEDAVVMSNTIIGKGCRETRVIGKVQSLQKVIRDWWRQRVQVVGCHNEKVGVAADEDW